MKDRIEHTIATHQRVITDLETLTPKVIKLAARVRDSLARGGKVLLMGNGGSAADCQHIAAELVGRFQRQRLGLPALALTTDTSALTPVGNDYGFKQIFARQVEALARSGDVLIGISTSGNSENVVAAIRRARGSLISGAPVYSVALAAIWRNYAILHSSSRRP
jgi:D-sedoheptulose 7-phosphate isomerase